MEITANKMTSLQAAIEAARKKNSSLRPTQETMSATNTKAVRKTAKASRNIAEISIGSSKLIDRFYGNKTPKQEQTGFLIGSRFDTYA